MPVISSMFRNARDVEWGSAINGEDRTIIGKDVPDFTYGINLNLQYKDFELSILDKVYLEQWLVLNLNRFLLYVELKPA